MGTVEKNSSMRKAAAAAGIILLLAVIPMLLIGIYDHPCADDFTYGQAVRQMLKSTGSPAAVLSAAAGVAGSAYRTWQGSFSAVFLMALQPASFGETAYRCTPVLLLLAYIGGTLFLLRGLLRGVMGADRYEFRLIAFLLAFVSIQFTYSPVEGFYWYNGGIYYTFFYSLALVLFGLLLLAEKTQRGGVKILCRAVSFPLAFIIGGGNYTTALTVSLILLAVLIYRAAAKKRFLLYALLFLTVLAALLVSAAAPGNGVRQASVGSPSAVKAIFLGIVFGAYSIFNATTLPVVIFWIFLTPFLYSIARRSPYSFRHPFLAGAFLFLLYSAQAAPPFYAIGIDLPERLINIIYFSYYIFTLIFLLYFCGWLARRAEKAEAPSLLVFLKGSAESLGRNLPRFAAAAVLLFLCACVGLCRVQKGANGKAVFTQLPASVSASKSLLSGEARGFDREERQRLAAYLDPEQKQVTVAEHAYKPALLFENDVTQDPNDWRNKAAAGFYGKEQVILRPGDAKSAG